MDPDAALANLRDALREMDEAATADDDEGAHTAALDAAEAARALDEWISHGGALPSGWQETADSRPARRHDDPDADRLLMTCAVDTNAYTLARSTPAQLARVATLAAGYRARSVALVDGCFGLPADYLTATVHYESATTGARSLTYGIDPHGQASS